MRVAVPIWQGRISPVFDVARRLRIVEAEDGRITSQVDHEICAENRAKELSDLGVKVLICGAITSALETTLWTEGIEVISKIRGPVGSVLTAYLNTRLNQKCFAIPGREKRVNQRTGAGVES
jgi:predicted Fe-Mo cluster-binding NifX family protein